MKIQQVQKDDQRAKDFETIEWEIADKEHYGGNRDFQMEKFLFLATDDNEKVCGLLKMVITAGVTHIEDLLVSHEHRREGIGKALVEHAEKISKQKKVHKIHLDTGKNWDAEKVYLSLGYVKTGELKNHFLGYDYVLFEKFLE